MNAQLNATHTTLSMEVQSPIVPSGLRSQVPADIPDCGPDCFNTTCIQLVCIRCTSSLHSAPLQANLANHLLLSMLFNVIITQSGAVWEVSPRILA